MLVKKTTHIGTITDNAHNIQLKAWKVSVEKGTRVYTPHRHINFEIMMVNSGRGRYTTEKTSYEMLPGDIFVFCSNECHCITEIGEEGLKITNLQFDPIFIRDSFPSPNFCFTHSDVFCNRLRYDTADSQTQFFQLICDELKQKKQDYILSVKSYLNLFLIKLVRDFHYLDDASALQWTNATDIHHVFSYIDAHYTEKITLQELSSLIGLTPNYFCSIFKQVSGMTVWEYISAKRIDRAIELLTSKGYNRNILEIANLSGYNNTANFNKTFKRITGVTPKEYRASRSSLIS